MGNVSFEIDGGRLQINEAVRVQIDGKLSNAAGAPGILIKSGEVRIENGSDFALQNGLKMEGGSLVTLAKMAGPGEVAGTQGPSLISGDVTITGGDVRMNANLGQGGLDNTNEATLETTFSALLIHGKLNWMGGKFVGFVNSGSLASDNIRVFGDGSSCSISKDVTFDLSTSNRDPALTKLPANKTITIIDSDVMITGTPTLAGAVMNAATLSHSADDKQIVLKKS